MAYGYALSLSLYSELALLIAVDGGVLGADYVSELFEAVFLG